MNVLSTRIEWSQKCSGITKNEVMSSEKTGWIRSKRTIQFQRKGTKANPGILQNTKAQGNKVLPKKSSPLDCKETKPVTPEGNQPWIVIGRTDAEASILRPPDEKNWLTEKNPDAGKDWRQEIKRVREHEVILWHHWLDGDEYEQTLEDSEGQEACHGTWCRKVRHN